MRADSLSGRRLRIGYYLDNLESLFDFVEARSGDLLLPAELAFLEAFRGSSLDARRLWARLAVRRGPWFRIDRLRYSEIDLARAIPELVERGLAERGEEDSAQMSFDFAQFAPLLRLLGLPALEVFRVLYFGNFGQSLEQFVLRDLGLVRFEEYDLEASGRRFASRAEFDSVAFWRGLREGAADSLREGLEKMLGGGRVGWEGVGAVRPLAVVAQRYFDECLVLVGRGLEREGRHSEALELFLAAQRPPGRERAVRSLEKLARHEEARALVEAMVISPRDESERIFSEKRLAGKRLAPSRAPSRRAFEEWTVEVEPGVVPIELRTLEALRLRGYQGAFGENALWRTLFGLYFWEEIWAPVPGAFAHPFQYGPLDLHDGWRERREPTITDKLRRLADDERPGERLIELWRSKHGTASSLVFFPPESFPAFELASSSLSGKHLAPVFERLSRDLARYGSGFPDLFLISPDGLPAVAEVKGPNDVLRPEQIGWLEHFAASGLRSVVVHSRPPKSN